MKHRMRQRKCAKKMFKKTDTSKCTSPKSRAKAASTNLRHNLSWFSVTSAIHVPTQGLFVTNRRPHGERSDTSISPLAACDDYQGNLDKSSYEQVTAVNWVTPQPGHWCVLWRVQVSTMWLMIITQTCCCNLFLHFIFYSLLHTRTHIHTRTHPPVACWCQMSMRLLS